VPVPERPEAPSVTPDTELVDGFAAASMGSSTLRTANPDTRNPLWEARRRRRPRAVGRDAGGGGTSDGDGGGDGGVCWDARQKKISALSRRAPSFYIARGSLRGKTDPLVSLSGGPGGGGRRRVARAASFGGRERAMAGDFGGKLWEGVVSGWPTCQICGGIWVVSGISMRDARPRAPRGRPRGCRLRRCGAAAGRGRSVRGKKVLDAAEAEGQRRLARTSPANCLYSKEPPIEQVQEQNWNKKCVEVKRKRGEVKKIRTS
jgi:hypothetical protein